MFSSLELAPLRIAKVEALVYRAPIAQTVQTSFGTMYNRPALLIRIEDSEGCVGWGEVWCNFPSVGAEHRARIIDSCITPILLEREWPTPQYVFAELSQRLSVLAIQSGEPGTFAQVVAGVDVALWDLSARKLAQPLWRLLGGSPKVATYASGISPSEAVPLALQKRSEGYTAFKLKVGFGADRDLENLHQMREALGEDTTLMVDANQAWSVSEAQSMIKQLAKYKPLWLEEPIRADHGLNDWRHLAEHSVIRLAVGENIRGHIDFQDAIESSAFGVLQPDVGKWGGFSGCVPVGNAAVAKKLLFCPHWLGAGIGLVASMHLKAICGGEGYVEVDSNPNPLRDLFAEPYLRPKQGYIELSTEPGLGVNPDIDRAREFFVQH